MSYRMSVVCSSCLHARLETALRHVLVYLGATDIRARTDDVDGGFLAALQLSQHLIDHTLVDQILQALGGFHAWESFGKRKTTPIMADRRPRPWPVLKPPPATARVPPRRSRTNAAAPHARTRWR